MRITWNAKIKSDKTKQGLRKTSDDKGYESAITSTHSKRKHGVRSNSGYQSNT